ncbi:uncharacterized protein LOC113343350 isoform X2 [Papaver somniferum]|uniref:uncharacterized protein LOC113343350 isoform X2 n=1 Tax=Papaver somniferum TaxID=3469 RepID=UPI000E6F6C36|nr:uncharacterized protein LOC113343350 isoform X2 [Papaver somniferum]XP_026443359.1 uncharacterized protein LOC113343350 isoform X2 [Papaver somniferum]
MNYFESINLTEMSFYATVHTFYIDLCIVCKYHKDVINLEEVEKRRKKKVGNQAYLNSNMSILTPVKCTSCERLESKMFGFISRHWYSLGFTKGTKLSTMDTRLNAKSSTEILRRLRKGARLSLEQENRTVADENVVLWTKFSKLVNVAKC